MDQEIVQALGFIALAGGFGGLVGGFLGGGKHLIGAILLGIIGGIAASAIARIAGAPPGWGVGDSFSILYGLGGGFLLGFVVNKSS
jgi:hypothetical protein